VLVWLLGIAFALALAAEVAYLVGRKSPEDPRKVDAVLAAVASPGVALAIAFTALVLLTWCVRNLVLHYLAWRPGRIEVARFAAATHLSQDPADLALIFQRQLATLHLQAPTPTPGAAPEGDFLAVLGGGTVDQGNLLATLLNFIRAGAPTHAYEVTGVLSESRESPRCSITVQVVELPSQAAVPILASGESWDEALTRAADEATAAILPRTGRCRAPWRAWRGSAMPPQLLHHYEQGSRFEQARRYDEALREYFAAAELDPMNITLRLRLGQLQERMGLFLDALDTYRSIEATARPANSHLPLWLYRGAARRQRRRARFSARYRSIVLLGGRVLAEQWRTPPKDPETRRDQQRDQLRSRLRPYLQRELENLRDVTPERVRQALDDTDLAPRTDEDQDDDPRFRELRELLARHAIKEARRLRRLLLVLFFDRRSTLTPATLSLTAECIKLRQRWLENLRHETGQWPPDPYEVRNRIWAIEWGPVRRSFRLWHEHYNAACAYALALQDTVNLKPDDPVRHQLARMAVCRLQKATTRANSGYIASRRDWLVSEDPDLKGLRDTPEFKDFEVMYLPAAKPTPRRPKNVQQLESSRYMNDLLVATAQLWQRAWHRRACELDTSPDIHTVLDWFSHELDMWGKVQAVAHDYRNSGTRLELIKAVAKSSARYGLEPLSVGFPRYEDAPLTVTPEDCDKTAKEEVETANKRLRGLWCELRSHEPQEPATRLLDDLTSWQTTLRLFDVTSRAPSRYFLAQLCDHHATMWQLLERWLTAEGAKSEADAQKRFRDKVEQTRRLWGDLLAAWRPLSDALARASDEADPFRRTRARVVRVHMLAKAAQVRHSAGLLIGPQRQNGEVTVAEKTV
jgi:tetratricopeptide (TPR) repeat protein